MYRLYLTIESTQRAIARKDIYEKMAILIRDFISKNKKGLHAEHYKRSFSYYCFSNPTPMEHDEVYRKGRRYTVELRSLDAEFKDLRYYTGLETDDLRLVSVSSGKLFFGPTGALRTVTPMYFKTKRIQTDDYRVEVEHRLRENIIFRYVKSGMNSVDDLEWLRENLVRNIKLYTKVITIPFPSKRLDNGKSLLYHCIHADVYFHENEPGYEVQKILYAGGIGMSTSNGFGMMDEKEDKYRATP
ncbi:hypothetical protein [Pontibacillus halophilus]|uniref:hypothetical protein n=1 Tax=Pontibacillus halophilus TaxID=516704 RepID=UPI0004063C2C|nr:hypothetical protein [Pontibacillus halophilus]